MHTKKETESSSFQLYGSVYKKFQVIREEQQDSITKKQLNFYRKQIDMFRQKLTSMPINGHNKTGRLIKVLEDYDTKYDSLVNGLDNPFMLFVVGTGKYGKSTLINALLEKAEAEVNFSPKTWKIDVFRKDIPSNQVIIKYRNKRETKVSKEKAKEISAIEEKRRNDSDKQIKAKLNEKKKSLSREEWDELKTKLEREELYNSDIIEMHWGMESSPVLDDFYIVDTPGLKQTVMGEVRNNVRDYYHKADGVLWMLDATAISANNVKKLVQDLEDSLSRGGGNQQSNIIAVLNRIDLIRNNQGDEGVQQVLADAKKIFKGYFRKIIPFSATEAFEATTKKDSVLMESSGWDALYHEIHHAFYKNAKTIQNNKKIESNKAYNREVAAILEEYLQNLENDLEKMKDGQETIDSQLEREEEKLLDHAKAQLNNYKKRVEDNIRYQAETFLNIKDSERQKRFVDAEIFETHILTGLLKEFQNEEVQTFTEFIKHYRNKIYFTEYPNLQKQSQVGFQKEVDFQVNIGRDGAGENLLTYGSGIAAGLVASLFLGPLGLLVGGIVSWFAKNSIRDDLKRSLRNELDNIITDMTSKLNENVEAYSESAYEEIMESALSSFAQVYSFEQLDDFDQWEENIRKSVEEGCELLKLLTDSNLPFHPSLKELLLEGNRKEFAHVGY